VTQKSIKFTSSIPIVKSKIGDKQSSSVLKKIDLISQNQPDYIVRLYKEMAEANPYNAHILFDNITAEQTEINIKESIKSDKIKKLCLLVF
jgi:hypothetical protein